MATPDAEETMVLDPIKLKSMLPIDGSMEKGFIGELMTPTEASTSCPTSTSPSRVPSPRSKGTADPMTCGDVEEVHVASVDRFLADALHKGDSESPKPSPKRKAKVGKKKDEKKHLALSIPPVQQAAAPPSPSKRATYGAPQQGWRTPTASPQHQATFNRSPAHRAPLVNQCAVQWTPCNSPFVGDDRFAMSPDGAGGLPPSPFQTAERPPFLDDGALLGADFRNAHPRDYPPPPTGPCPPPPGPYDQQWGHGWESWDEGVDHTPNNMNAPMPRYGGDCWGPSEGCEPAWAPMQQGAPMLHQGQGCGGWGDAMPVPRKGRSLGMKKKPDKLTAFLPDNGTSRTTPKSDATSTPSAHSRTPTAGRLPNQYSGMQFSYAVSAAPPPPPSQQYKKAATPTARPLRDAVPQKPDLFAQVCRVMLAQNCEMRLREYEAVPYED